MVSEFPWLNPNNLFVPDIGPNKRFDPGPHRMSRSDFSIDWNLQKYFIPVYPQRQEIVRGFHSLITSLVAQSADIKDSLYRAKTDESIWAKIERRVNLNRDRPIYDIYGVRLILDSIDVPNVQALLLHSFSPEYRFPFDLPNIIDYTDPNSERKDYSDPQYQAIHVLLPFGDGPLPNIGEVQLMTSRQSKVAQLTRETYERKRINYALGIEV